MQDSLILFHHVLVVVWKVRNALVKFSDTSLTLCLDYANKLNSGKEGWGTLCSDENSQSQHRKGQAPNCNLFFVRKGQRNHFKRPSLFWVSVLWGERQKQITKVRSLWPARWEIQTETPSSESQSWYSEQTHSFGAIYTTGIAATVSGMSSETITDTKSPAFEAATDTTTFWASSLWGKRYSKFRVFVQRDNTRCSTSRVSILERQSRRIKFKPREGEDIQIFTTRLSSGKQTFISRYFRLRVPG